MGVEEFWIIFFSYTILIVTALTIMIALFVYFISKSIRYAVRYDSEDDDKHTTIDPLSSEQRIGCVFAGLALIIIFWAVIAIWWFG